MSPTSARISSRAIWSRACSPSTPRSGLFLGPRSPNTVFSLLYRLAGFGRHGMGGLHLPMGGMGALADALAQAAMRAGVVVRTGARVEQILVEKETAVGVVLAGGEEIRAPIVACSADPQRTLLKLVEPGNLDAQFLSASAICG